MRRWLLNLAGVLLLNPDGVSRFLLVEYPIPKRLTYSTTRFFLCESPSKDPDEGASTGRPAAPENLTAWNLIPRERNTIYFSHAP